MNWRHSILTSSNEYGYIEEFYIARFRFILTLTLLLMPYNFSCFFCFKWHQSETRWERLKSALYIRLKKRKVFKICLGRNYGKLRQQFWDTQRVPFMLHKTGKPLFPQLGTKQHFLNEKTSDFFFSENVL